MQLSSFSYLLDVIFPVSISDYCNLFDMTVCIQKTFFFKGFTLFKIHMIIWIFLRGIKDCLSSSVTHSPISAFLMPPIFKYPTQNTLLHPNAYIQTNTHTIPHHILPGQHFNVSLANKQQRPLHPKERCSPPQLRRGKKFLCACVFTCVFDWKNSVGKSALSGTGVQGSKKGVFVVEWGLPGLC